MFDPACYAAALSHRGLADMTRTSKVLCMQSCLATTGLSKTDSIAIISLLKAAVALIMMPPHGVWLHVQLAAQHLQTYNTNTNDILECYICYIQKLCHLAFLAQPLIHAYMQM